MSTDRLATPYASLPELASEEASVLEALAQLQVGTLERSNLDEDTDVLVRLGRHRRGPGLLPRISSSLLVTAASS